MRKKTFSYWRGRPLCATDEEELCGTDEDGHNVAQTIRKDSMWHC